MVGSVVNVHGLGRNIPVAVKQEVRSRCKFGCVMCRSGFYQYEHIDPYASVAEHDPDRICCLCAACHDRVTRGQLSKAAVQAAYLSVWRSAPEAVVAPSGPLDFYSSNAHLVIGGLRYSPLISSLLVYHGQELFRVEPGVNGTPGSISALFFDDLGNPIFRLIENEWVGEPTNWDIEVVGPRLRVRNPNGRVVLALRLEPPGTVVVECLDMRCNDAHVLVSEKSYAVGRYLDGDVVAWMYADLTVTRAVPEARGFEFMGSDELHARTVALDGVGQSMSTSNGAFIFGSPLGVVCPSLGISIGYGSTFGLYGSAMAILPVSNVRKLVQQDPAGLAAAFRQ